MSNPDDTKAVMAWLRSRDGRAMDIAHGVGLRVERVCAALVQLDAQELIEFVTGEWRLTTKGEEVAP